MRVLIVEDDPLVSSLVAETVEGMRHQPLVVATSNDALAILTSEETIDIMVADVMMHGMSGIELAKRSRAIRPGMSVILTSGYPAEMLAIPEQCHFIGKPFALSELTRLIEVAG